MERHWTIKLKFDGETELIETINKDGSSALYSVEGILNAAHKYHQHELETKAIALSARYNEEADLIEINLKDGSTFTVPPYSVQGLRGGTPEQLNDIWLDSDGLSIHWEQLDADFSVHGIVNGIYGTKQWMKQLEMEGK